jgi:DNA-binding transcriptional MerR regulator
MEARPQTETIPAPAEQREGLMSLDEVAKRLGVSVTRVRQLRDYLPRVTIEGRAYISKADVERYLETRKTTRRIATRRRKVTTPEEVMEKFADLLREYERAIRRQIADEVKRR